MTTTPHPAAKPKRRWFQFSLRTLLIGTAVIAAIFGVGLRSIAPAQRQRAAVKMVEQLGGEVVYADAAAGESWIVTKLRDWLPREYFDVLGIVDLEGTAAADSDIALLNGLTQLKGLSLEKTQVTDAGFVHLERLTQLQALFFNHTNITDVGLTHLKGLTQLHTLGFEGTQITDVGLVHLDGLTGLQTLYIMETQVTDSGVAELQKSLPDCQIER